MRSVVLAGGESSRMGREKALMEFKGKALIKYGIDSVSGFPGKPLVISNNNEVVQFLENVEVIPDFMPGRGPMGGIFTALKHTCDDVCIVPCDAPFLEKDTVERLVEEWDTESAVVYMNDGRIYPMPGIYTVTLMPEIERRLEGVGKDLSLQELIREEQNVKYVEIGDEKIDQLIGINTPEDFKRATGRDLEEL